MVELSGLDYKNALKRMGGKEDLYYRMIENFQKEYKDFPYRIKELMDLESDDAYVLTHSLKNISAAIGAVALSESAEQMEVFLKDGSYRGNDLYFQRLIEEFNSVMLLLDSWKNPLNKEIYEPQDPSAFIIQCQNALTHYSPTEVKKCRQLLENGKWPERIETYKDALISSLKGFRYQEAAEILGKIAPKV